MVHLKLWVMISRGNIRKIGVLNMFLSMFINHGTSGYSIWADFQVNHVEFQGG